MLLDKGADFITQDNNGWTPLNEASCNGHAEIVKLLLEKGADFTTQNNNDAADKGADFVTRNSNGWTPFHVASNRGHVDVVELLLRAPHFNKPEGDTLGRTALFLPSRSGQVDVVQYLLSLKRFDPDTKNYNGSTALSTAVANGHCKVVELLIAAGVNAQDQLHVGRSLLWWASHAGKPQMIKMLSHPMELGETFSQADKAVTAFDTAAAWCDVFEAAQLLYAYVVYDFDADTWGAGKGYIAKKCKGSADSSGKCTLDEFLNYLKDFATAFLDTGLRERLLDLKDIKVEMKDRGGEYIKNIQSKVVDWE
ncbi:unnamed protein product [Clonostachys rhizophaga]|uniref:Uncharacterized protein n=1 Tax=Clonostachys rhizophaga TaxID=160324 RepID=A0A9N9VBE0_9HYPO|nr:unnamed protein product [Clonostachys rhizophaga]